MQKNNQYRTYYTDEINNKLINKNVKLAGWVQSIRDHGAVTFIDFRDYNGKVQVLIDEKNIAKQLRNEFLIIVDGFVRKRPDGNDNKNLINGDVEIVSKKTTIINKSAPLPFQLDENPNEDTKIKYRYLDLRRPEQMNRLKIRSKMGLTTRNVLESENFTEVETPTLTRSTPEGARDFLVPSRLNPGKWYALPQSPQLFKQLLMVSGVENYYQICRCYRDEDFRADRQPEFTQLDIEMSFATQDNVIELSEKVIKNLWSIVGIEVKTPIEKMTFKNAMDFYGSDKPDLRFGIKLTELTSIFENTNFSIFKNVEYIGAVVMPGGAEQSRRTLDKWQDWAKSKGAKGLAYILLDTQTGTAKGAVAKNLTNDEIKNVVKKTNAEKGDCIFFAAGQKLQSQELLGFCRLEIANMQKLLNENEFKFVWIVDPPLFKKTNQDDDIAVGGKKSEWTAVHHAFTMPKNKYLETLENNPGNFLADSYDIVCN